MKQVLLLSLLSLFTWTNFQAQEKGTGPREKTFKQELKSNKQLRREARDRRRMEREERKAVKKYHKRLQTKDVRKRMKASRRKAQRYHDNKREFFLKRWFTKRRR